jgi:hypothetical protein
LSNMFLSKKYGEYLKSAEFMSYFHEIFETTKKSPILSWHTQKHLVCSRTYIGSTWNIMADYEHTSVDHVQIT